MIERRREAVTTDGDLLQPGRGFTKPDPGKGVLPGQGGDEAGKHGVRVGSPASAPLRLARVSCSARRCLPQSRVPWTHWDLAVLSWGPVCGEQCAPRGWGRRHPRPRDCTEGAFHGRSGSRFPVDHLRGLVTCDRGCVLRRVSTGHVRVRDSDLKEDIRLASSEPAGLSKPQQA